MEITIHKKRSMSPEEKQQIINELRLIPKKGCIFLKIYIPHHMKIVNLFINQGQQYNIKMEYQKISNLLND